jgi:hypothetical protein
MPSVPKSSHHPPHRPTDVQTDATDRTSQGTMRHALEIGDAVTVFAYDDFGPFIEGVGTVDSCAAATDHYWVRFDHDPNARLRFVQPEWQSCPDRALVLLRAFWRSCRSNQSTIEDFFPDSSR